MLPSFAVALSVTTSQLPGLYVRYIPFQELLSDTQKKQLKIFYAAWFILENFLIISLLYTNMLPLTFLTAKQILITGWIPFFLANLYIIRHYAAQQIFVLGMLFIYNFMIHTIVMNLLLFFIPEQYFLLADMSGFYGAIYMELILYIIFFILLFPFIRGFFKTIFISYHALSNHYYWRFICLLPLLLIANNMTMFMKNEVLANEQLLARFLLACCAIILGKCITLDFKLIQERLDLGRRNTTLSMQLRSLYDHSRLLQESKQKMAILRHDNRHQLNILSTLIQKGQTDEALKLIDRISDDISSTAIESFCENPIINAALSVYIPRARQIGIDVTYAIDLPETLKMDTDLAIVLSNLLENAINASDVQPKGQRKLHLQTRTRSDWINLVIENRYDKPVEIDSDGLPVTHRQGHGLGMKSLLAFSKKYDASVLCKQKKGWFRLYLNFSLS